MKYKKLDSLQTSKPPLSGSQYGGKVGRNYGVINYYQFDYDITFFIQSKHIYYVASRCVSMKEFQASRTVKCSLVEWTLRE